MNGYLIVLLVSSQVRVAVRAVVIGVTASVSAVRNASRSEKREMSYSGKFTQSVVLLTRTAYERRAEEMKKEVKSKSSNRKVAKTHQQMKRHKIRAIM